jgi:hypothetical protein
VTASTQIKIVGLEETLKELRKVEPQYVKDFRKRARVFAADAVVSAKKEFDHQSDGWREPDRPLVGMNRGSLVRGRNVRWDARKARRSIKFKLGGPTKRTRVGKSYRMFAIMQADAAGAIYDMAGKRNSNPKVRFEETLAEFVDIPHTRPQAGRPNKGPSRYMYPGIEFYLPVLEERMLGLVRELEAKTNKKLVKGRRR